MDGEALGMGVEEDVEVGVEEAVVWSLRVGLTWCFSPRPSFCALWPLDGEFNGTFLVGGAGEVSVDAASKGGFGR